ncbi:MAG: hypothetical protein JOY60_18070 [Burkholderiaceae bacterium]|nr:hypothetical protein [Burkholderiaceae bacterium]
MYIGGEFTHVGTPTGSFVPVDANTGAVVQHLVVNGSIRAQLADGTGGWFITGSFTTIGNTSQAGFAHFKADGSLDNEFYLAPNLTVTAMALNGSDLYVSGCYQGGARNGQCIVEDVDAATGSVLKWSVGANTSASHLAVSGNSLYMSGSFQTFAGANRFNMAALDTRTGALLPWNPNIGYGAGVPFVNAIVASSSAVFIGGQFTTIGGATRNSVAAVDPTSGQALAWDAKLSTTHSALEVYAIVQDGSTIYVGGVFSSAAGQTRGGLVALDATTGAVSPWSAGLSLDAYDDPLVAALTVNTGRVFVGGQFFVPGSSALTHTASFDKVSAAPLPWLDAQDQNIAIKQLGVAGSQVFVGGDFALLGGLARSRVAAIDLTSGQVTTWDPDSVNTDGDSSTGVVSQLLVSGSTVYAAGIITHIGGADRYAIAALDGTTGAALPWSPQIVGGVTTMTSSSTTLFVGGAGLTSVNGQTRGGLAAFDLVSGQLTSWAPNVTGAEIVRLLATDSAVYIGGAFATIDGQPRHGLAAFDPSSGALLPWNPDVETMDPTSGFNISDMALSSGTLYFVGDFSTVGGQSRIGIAAVDSGTGAVDSFGATSAVIHPRGLCVNGNLVYVEADQGGGTPPAQAVFIFSTAKNPPPATQYIVQGWVDSIVPLNGYLYFAGQFTDSATGLAPNITIYPQ